MLEFADRVALEVACRSFELHGVELDRTCRHCGPGTAWPCASFVRAHRVIRLLTSQETRGDDNSEVQPISPKWLEGRSSTAAED